MVGIGLFRSPQPVDSRPLQSSRDTPFKYRARVFRMRRFSVDSIKFTGIHFIDDDQCDLGQSDLDEIKSKVALIIESLPADHRPEIQWFDGLLLIKSMTRYQFLKKLSNSDFLDQHTCDKLRKLVGMPAGRSYGSVAAAVAALPPINIFSALIADHSVPGSDDPVLVA